MEPPLSSAPSRAMQEPSVQSQWLHRFTAWFFRETDPFRDRNSATSDATFRDALNDSVSLSTPPRHGIDAYIDAYQQRNRCVPTATIRRLVGANNTAETAFTSGSDRITALDRGRDATAAADPGIFSGGWRPCQDSKADHLPTQRMARLEEIVTAAGPLTLAQVQARSVIAAAIVNWVLAVAAHWWAVLAAEPLAQTTALLRRLTAELSQYSKAHARSQTT
eukprot:SAG31_NODE_11128_length_1063_cov_1.216805_1_plen_221_part_00